MYFSPGTTGVAFTGRGGQSYVTTGGPVDFPPENIALACLNGWQQMSLATAPGLLDIPQLGVAMPYPGVVAPIKLFQTGVPMIIAPTGTMANNGAITLGTALPTGFMNGPCYLYLPTGAIAASSVAGFYYTVMTSTTLGTVYNLTYTSGQPYVPASPVAFVTTGPGAYTGSTSSQTALSFSLPGNLMGFNGLLEVSALFGFHGSTNNKTVEIEVNEVQIFVQVNATTATVAYQAFVNWGNQGATGAQFAQTVGASGALTTAQTYTAVDTTTTQTVTVDLTCATATDWISVDNFSCTVTPG